MSNPIVFNPLIHYKLDPKQALRKTDMLLVDDVLMYEGRIPEELVDHPAEKTGRTVVRLIEPLGVYDRTARGFPIVLFKDSHGHDIRLQESSACVCENEHEAVKDPLGWLWLGIMDPNPQILKSKAKQFGLKLVPGEEVSGWMPFPIPKEVMINTEMHLNEAQVRGLIARLQHWVDTGTLDPEVVA